MLQIMTRVLALKEGIDEGRLRHGLHQHVRLVDGLPAPDAGPVEAKPALKGVLVHLPGRDGEVLPESRKIHESEIHDLDTFPL